MFISLVIIAVALIWYFRMANAQAKIEKEQNDSERCRRCDYDLRGTPTRCPECGQLSRTGRIERLQNNWPTESIDPRVPELDEKWNTLYTADLAMEATLLQQHLEARGVACRVEANAKTFLLAGSYGPVYEIQQLRVPAADFERAATVLMQLVEEEPAERVAIIASDAAGD